MNLKSTKLTVLPLILLALVLNFSSCSSAKKKGQDPSSTTEGASDAGLTLELNGDSDSGKAGALQTVYFPYDSSQVTSSARESLDKNAEFLKSNPNVSVQIEGHADERGSVEYNLALGERRAKAVKNYLVTLGVAADKLTTISYGKERPIEFGHAEDAWSKNRRANFVVTAK